MVLLCISIEGKCKGVRTLKLLTVVHVNNVPFDLMSVTIELSARYIVYSNRRVEIALDL